MSKIFPNENPQAVIRSRPERVQMNLPKGPPDPWQPTERRPVSLEVPELVPAADQRTANVNPVLAAVVVGLVVGALGVGLYFYWKWVLAALIALFLFMRRAARF